MTHRVLAVLLLLASASIASSGRAETETSTTEPKATEPATEPKTDPETTPTVSEEASAETLAATTAEAPIEEARPAPEQPQDEAEYLHAEAIDAELTGNHPRALEILRRAHELSPDDNLIRFDLARIGMLHGGSQKDLQPFLDAPLADPASLALREAIVAQTVAPDQRLRLLDGRLTARLRLGTSIDTNVAIAPFDDSPFLTDDGAPTAPITPPTEQLLGVRVVSDGQLVFSPLRGTIALDFATWFRLGTFLNSAGNTLDIDTGTRTARLERFDSNRISLAALGRLNLEPFFLNLLVSGTEVSFANFNRHFMQSVDSSLELLLGSEGGGHFGFYGNFGARDFVDGNRDGTPEDRDGPYVAGGLMGDWNTRGTVGFAARLGVLREFAQGSEQEVYGAYGSLVLVTNVGPVHGDLGVSHQARVYGEASPGDWSDLADLRVDNRLSPFARVNVDVWQHLGFYGLYSFTTNLSTHNENIAPRAAGVPLHLDRTFRRHFIEFGVEGRI